MDDSEAAEALLSPVDQFVHQFYEWEIRGRGWLLWDRPVEPEPPFAPFFAHSVSYGADGDDGRKHTLISGLIDWLHQKVMGQRTGEGCVNDQDNFEESGPRLSGEPDGLVELQVSVPSDLQVSREAAEQFLLTLSSIRRPLAYELIGLPDAIVVQFTCEDRDADQVEQQLKASFPGISMRAQASFVASHCREDGEVESVVAEFGLEREFMLPLATTRSFSVDPLTGIAAALADVQAGEMAMLQVLFQPVRNPWAESTLRSVTFADGTPLFDGMRDFVKQAKSKVSRPLYGAVLRACCQSPQEERAWDLARRLVGSLAPLGDPAGNELIPLENDGYDFSEHIRDVLLRRSRRCGMLWNSDELISLVHLPSASVRVQKLRGAAKRSKAAPSIVLGNRVALGKNEHASEVRTVTLNPEQRAKHMHVIGASGTGKSTLLLNLITQDIRNGDGVAVLDPHGDLIDAIIERIPPKRAEDVVIFDPADEEYPVGFNILSARSEVEKNLLSSDLVAVFRRLSTSWGDQMNAVLGNAIIAFLESSRGGTLIDLRRFLVESAFRREFLTTVRDEEIVYFWTKEFPLLKGRPEGPVLTRLDTFLRPKLIRYMVGQKDSQLDFDAVMNQGRIFLARLSHGAIGEENAHLLGTLLVSKFHQTALNRQRLAEVDRRYFWLYVDEFQNFATPSMAGILSGVRKYRLGLTLAHQELRQLANVAPDVASAIGANAYTRVYFRVGSDDAKKLAEGLTSFEPMDLQNLAVGEAICRVEKPEFDFNLRTAPIERSNEEQTAVNCEAVLALSRGKYGSPRANVEAKIQRSRGVMEPEEKGAPVNGKDVPSSEAATVPAKECPVPIPIQQSPSSAVRKSAKPASAQAAQMGRGGPEHIYLQQFIKQYAEGLGYKASIEECVLGRRGVDVALTKGDVKIACEICITTEIDHELGNVQKCLEAGFNHVVAVATNAKRLERLKEGIIPQLTSAECERVKFLSPDKLFAFIQELEIADLNTEQTVRGYKVRTTRHRLDHDESQNRREAVTQVVAKAMKRINERRRPR